MICNTDFISECAEEKVCLVIILHIISVCVVLMSLAKLHTVHFCVNSIILPSHLHKIRRLWHNHSTCCWILPDVPCWGKFAVYCIDKTWGELWRGAFIKREYSISYIGWNKQYSLKSHSITNWLVFKMPGVSLFFPLRIVKFLREILDIPISKLHKT